MPPPGPGPGSSTPRSRAGIKGKIDELLVKLPEPAQAKLADLEKSTGQPKSLIAGGGAVFATLLFLFLCARPGPFFFFSFSPPFAPTRRVEGEEGPSSAARQARCGAERSSDVLPSSGPPQLVFSAVGVAYPMYASLLMLAEDTTEDAAMWITYWCVFTSFKIIMGPLDFILSFLPFYFYLKLTLLVWLFSPTTKGAAMVYEKGVKPYVFPMLVGPNEKSD